MLSLYGLLGGARLGRLAALASLIQVALALSRTTVAAAISVIEIGAATLGIGASRLAHRDGLPRTLEWALAFLPTGRLGRFFAAVAPGLAASVLSMAVMAKAARPRARELARHRLRLPRRVQGSPAPPDDPYTCPVA